VKKNGNDVLVDTSLIAAYYIPEPLSDKVEAGHYHLARYWLGLFNTSLRSLEALHLAVASTGGLTVATADLGLSKSARVLGLEVLLLSVGKG